MEPQGSNTLLGLDILCRVLDAHGITYWVDSGVLLGLRREGRLLSWEKDIDLAVLISDEVKLLDSLDDFRAAGYTPSENRYRGHLYSVGLEPDYSAETQEIRAAVHVFYSVDMYLVSPQTQIYVPPPVPDVRHTPRTPVGTLLKAAIEKWFYDEPAPGSPKRASRAQGRATVPYRAARAIYRNIDRGRLAETWPISEVFVPLTWVFPRDLVVPIARQQFGVGSYPVPSQVDKYLTYRYGDWRQPEPDWCYWVDDGAIRHGRPVEVLRQLSASPSNP
jgi:hypothetical protein